MCALAAAGWAEAWGHRLPCQYRTQLPDCSAVQVGGQAVETEGSLHRATVAREAAAGILACFGPLRRLLLRAVVVVEETTQARARVVVTGACRAILAQAVAVARNQRAGHPFPQPRLHRDHCRERVEARLRAVVVGAVTMAAERAQTGAVAQGDRVLPQPGRE